MKIAVIFFLTVFCVINIPAQGINSSNKIPTSNDLQKLIETEKAFAKAAEEKGTKTAFLEFLADDGIVFNPAEANGKLVWKARPESPALLSWNPAWADLSSDGKLGYTTGGWELRPKGKTDKPTAFGDYVTLWQKQADGSFKAILDIGIGHSTSNYSSVATRSPMDAGSGAKSVKSGIGNATLNDIFSNKSMADGYFNYLADDCLVLRDGNLPFSGKQNAFFALERLDKDYPPTSFLNFSANMSKVYGNLMYVWGEYKLTAKDETFKKWSFVQIWKNRAGKWQLVLDVFHPHPTKK